MGSKSIGLAVYDVKHNDGFVFDTTTITIRFLLLLGTPEVSKFDLFFLYCTGHSPFPLLGDTGQATS